MDVYTMYTEMIALNVKNNFNNKIHIYYSLNSHETQCSKIKAYICCIYLLSNLNL